MKNIDLKTPMIYFDDNNCNPTYSLKKMDDEAKQNYKEDPNLEKVEIKKVEKNGSKES